MPDEIDIETAATEPRKASGDGIAVENHSLPDLIAADKHLRAKAAASSKTGGVRFSKIVPPGTSGGR